MPWLLRGVHPSDLEGLVDLVEASMDRPWSARAVAAAVDGAGARARVAVRDAELGGFVLARRVLDLLEIDLVGVHPDHRRQGLGRRLLSELLADEGATGLREARLELAAANEAALALYAGLGFVVVGRRTRYYPDGDDALLLSRSIV